MKMIELTIELDHGTYKARTLTMSFNHDHIISVAPSKDNKDRCWMKMTDETFVVVLRPYSELVYALRTGLEKA